MSVLGMAVRARLRNRYPSACASAELYGKLRYDTGHDLAPIMEVLRAPFVLVIHASSPSNSVRDLIAAAKRKPGELGAGEYWHRVRPPLAGVLFGIMTGATFNHVPYKGGGPAIQNLIANRVQALFTTPLAGNPHVQSGRLRLLAVMSAKRATGLPNTPTIAESGVKDDDVSTWYILLAPAKTAPQIIAQVHRDTVATLKQPDAVKILGMGNDGAELVLSTPEQGARLLRAESSDGHHQASQPQAED